MTTFTGSIPTIASGDNATVAANLATYRDALKAVSEAWTAWTPTITSETGTLTTTSSSNCRYLKVNKLVMWSATLTITTVGTGAAGLRFTLPTAAATGVNDIGHGRESASTGAALTVTYIAGVGQVLRYDNATVLASGRTCNLSGLYEAA